MASRRRQQPADAARYLHSSQVVSNVGNGVHVNPSFGGLDEYKEWRLRRTWPDMALAIDAVQISCSIQAQADGSEAILGCTQRGDVLHGALRSGSLAETCSKNLPTRTCGKSQL